jgi:tetratricopeptide (TPR) repeat protein
MHAYKTDEIINIAQKGTSNEWELLLDFINSYQGDDDDIIGLKLFLNGHLDKNPREALLSFVLDIKLSKPKELKYYRLTRMPNWALAAVATLLLVSGLLINQYEYKDSIHMSDDALPIYLSSEVVWLNKGMAQYKKGDYNAALINFEKLNSDTGLYYAAICNELTANYTESVKKLNGVPVTSVFYSKAQIRLAAVYFELGKLDQAKDVLNNIKPSDALDAQRIKSIKIHLY